MSAVSLAPVPVTERGLFSRFAWLVLAYNIFVILWGALVRATGSGAGCGEHWPLCNGQVVPVLPQLHTAIEFTHRATSGLALLAVVALYFWSRRVFSNSEPPRRAAFFTLVFIVNETLIGAMLVLLGLVGQSRSPWRAGVLVLHLVNTFLLLASLALAAWWSAHPAPRSGGAWHRKLLFWALAAAILTGATGGIAALGDTLFPAASLGAGIEEEFSRSAPLLVRLRVLHPLIALAAGCYFLWLSLQVRGQRVSENVMRWSSAVVWLTLFQFGLGGVNILLLTPVWTQLAHLLLTNLLWVSLVLLTASVLAAPPAAPPNTPEPIPS
jgi:heme A synthase